MSTSKPKSIDDYLGQLGNEQRSALERIRRIIHRIVPEIGEAISYGLPSFRYRGRWLLHIGAASNHCAIYGIGALKEELNVELEKYDTSGKGTLRFQIDRPLPAGLVQKLIKARVKYLQKNQVD